MLIAEMVVDPATITCAVFAAVTWLLGISYFLGRYTAKLDATSKAHDELKAEVKGTLHAIFDKLDTLSKAVPHHCIQLDHITAMLVEIQGIKTTLAEHTGRMDRIQLSIRDSDQSAIRRHAEDQASLHG
jgi:hypothetical protein